MKLQYLGDSKDSFKWDYHDYLTSALGYSKLNVVLMRTPDDKSSDGKTEPKLFPARDPVLDFCHNLRKHRNVLLIQELPTSTGAGYRVDLHKPEIHLTRWNRSEYFSDISPGNWEVLFLDPDNGFEPEKSCNEKHILYSDIDAILEQVPDSTVVSVFHHFRRISFANDFARIKARVYRGYTTALYWQSLMFVAISKTQEIIEKVAGINHQYSQKYPVKVLHSTKCELENPIYERTLF
jgi:hypothetical protein